MKTTEVNYTPIQLKSQVDMERIIEINDSVYTFNEVVSHIDLKKYFVEKGYGEIKANRGYERFRRRGINKAILEIALISCGFNLHKYHLSRLAKAKTTKAAG